MDGAGVGVVVEEDGSKLWNEEEVVKAAIEDQEYEFACKCTFADLFSYVRSSYVRFSSLIPASLL